MKAVEDRGNGMVLVELSAIDLVNIITFLNQTANSRSVEEVEENDYKSSFAIYESYNTLIGGATLALKECLETGDTFQKVYNENDSEYIFLKAQNA